MSDFRDIVSLLRQFPLKIVTLLVQNFILLHVMFCFPFLSSFPISLLFFFGMYLLLLWLICSYSRDSLVHVSFNPTASQSPRCYCKFCKVIFLLSYLFQLKYIANFNTLLLFHVLNVPQQAEANLFIIQHSASGMRMITKEIAALSRERRWLNLTLLGEFARKQIQISQFSLVFVSVILVKCLYLKCHKITVARNALHFMQSFLSIGFVTQRVLSLPRFLPRFLF